jgi:hypothetical protein
MRASIATVDYGFTADYAILGDRQVFSDAAEATLTGTVFLTRFSDFAGAE